MIFFNGDSVKRNESWTSKTNSMTNKIEYTNLTLKDRTVKLNNNLVIDRDLNSAINIAKRIKGDWHPQFDNIIKCYHKIYLDENSNMIMSDSLPYIN
jgi:hypothetical protein